MSDIHPSIFQVWIKIGKDLYLGSTVLYGVTDILPDANAPKTRSLICTENRPEGFSVEGKSDDLIKQWSEQTVIMEVFDAMNEEEDEQTWAEAAEE